MPNFALATNPTVASSTHTPSLPAQRIHSTATPQHRGTTPLTLRFFEIEFRPVTVLDDAWAWGGHATNGAVLRD